MDKNNPLSDAYKAAESKALRTLIEEFVTHMAPINQAYLEPAVSQWFGKVYQDRFSKFTFEESQLEIVTRFANTIKKEVE